MPCYPPRRSPGEPSDGHLSKELRRHSCPRSNSDPAMANLDPTAIDPPRILFVTGRLAEFALRRVLDDLAPKAGVRPEVAVLPVSVAALMTPKWVARHLEVPPGIARVILPGHCRGDLSAIEARAGVPGALGPEDLRDLPRSLGQAGDRLAGYGGYPIEILAEINHAPRLSLDDFLAQAGRFVAEGAD